MRKIFIFMGCLFVLACNSGTDKKAEAYVKYHDLINDHLQGDIQSIEETPYKVDSTGKIGDMDSCCILVTDYDENGNAVTVTSKDSKGTVKNETVFTRDESGLWTGEKSTKEGGKPTGSMKVTVDDKGQITSAQTFDSTGKPDEYYTNVTQNQFGQVLTWKQYDKDSVFRMEGEAKYEVSLQVGFTLKDSVGKVKNSTVSMYNDKGEQTEFSNTDITKDSTTTKITKYMYDAHDEQGNWTQRTAGDDNRKATGITKRVYTYRKKDEKK